MTDAVAFWTAYLATGMTEPLTCSEVADLFAVGRTKAAAMLARMAGVERVDSLYRVPLHRMPPKYFRDRAPICSDLPDTQGPYRTNAGQ